MICMEGQQLILPPKNLPDAVFAATETEYSLTEALHYMYTLPYETSPNLLSENLSTAIENAGFLEDGNILRQSWDVQRLYTALTERFGTVFGGRISCCPIDIVFCRGRGTSRHRCLGQSGREAI